MTAQDIFDKFAAEMGDIHMKPSEAIALINFTLLHVSEQMEPVEEHEEKKTGRKKKA